MCNQYRCLTADVGVTEHSNVETASTDEVHVHDWALGMCSMHDGSFIHTRDGLEQ